MTYTENVVLTSEEFERINRLLALPYFDEMTDEEMREAEAHPHSCEGIFEVTFMDGSEFTYDLCSGGENYFDDMIFSNKYQEEYVLDCDFELDRQIVITDNGNKYIINIITE